MWRRFAFAIDDAVPNDHRHHIDVVVRDDDAVAHRSLDSIQVHYRRPPSTVFAHVLAVQSLAIVHAVIVVSIAFVMLVLLF